jgi:hypothetical protein
VITTLKHVKQVPINGYTYRTGWATTDRDRLFVSLGLYQGKRRVAEIYIEPEAVPSVAQALRETAFGLGRTV